MNNVLAVEQTGIEYTSLKQREHQCTSKLLLFYQHTRYSTYNKKNNHPKSE